MLRLVHWQAADSYKIQETQVQSVPIVHYASFTFPHKGMTSREIYCVRVDSSYDAAMRNILCCEAQVSRHPQKGCDCTSK